MAEGRWCCRRRWKRHIVRQLQQRDRAQKARFLDLVQSYNKLLEKSSLVDYFTETLQGDSLDKQMKLPPSSTQEPADMENDAAQTLVSLRRSYESQIVKLMSNNGELLCKMVEQNELLKARDATLEQQRSRLASLSEQLSMLEAECCQLQDQVEELTHWHATTKEQYNTLGNRWRQQDEEFRRETERVWELEKSLLRGKAQAAERKNQENERASRARLSKELKKATKRTVSIGEEPEEVEAEERKTPNKGTSELRSCENLCKRPFRSASATSMNLTRYMGVVKDWFDFRLKRGNSIGAVTEDRYCCIPTCVAACLPSRVSDEQEAHLSEINAIKFSPNSGLLATGGTDRLIRLWNVVGGRLENLQMLEGANGSITSVDFDPSGCHVLAASHNNAAQLWRIGDCKFKEILTGHTDKVTAARFRSTRYQAITGSRDRTVKEWDLGKGACSRTINAVSYCNDVVCCDTVIVSGHHDKTIRFWDSREPRCTQVIPVEGKVTSLSISQDQMHLLSCSRDDTLKVIDLRMLNIRQVFRADGFKCGSDWTKAVFSPDKSYALVGSADGTLYLWNMETGRLETRLPGVHRSSVNAVAWGPSGMFIGSVDRCRKVVLWR
ncbi:protein Atg16l2 [Tiliqua scincoides]|uniref:protein Atg16l2 n=1 Tax=Tiliqua scincoides TaxID=71010 RepID=UPI003462B994